MREKKYAVRFRIRDKQEIHANGEVISGTWRAYGWVHVKSTSKVKARAKAVTFLRYNTPDTTPQILDVKIE